MHSMAQTDTQTDGHGNYMTNSAQWGRVGEKTGKKTKHIQVMTTLENCKNVVVSFKQETLRLV